jgi:hypothetical protein
MLGSLDHKTSLKNISSTINIAIRYGILYLVKVRRLGPFILFHAYNCVCTNECSVLNVNLLEHIIYKIIKSAKLSVI